MSVIGGVWKPLILFHLLQGKKRFMELSRLIPNATQRMLTLQLRELEADGIIIRTVYPQVPPKVEYEISPFGQSLEPILISLKDWGEQYRQLHGNSHDEEEAVGSEAVSQEEGSA